MTQPNPSLSWAQHRQNILAIWFHVQVAHHLPGRLRIQLRPGSTAMKALRSSANQGVEALLQLLPGVQSFRMNALAGSLVMEYDPKILPFTLVDAFFRATSSHHAGDLLDRLLLATTITKGDCA